MPGSTALREQPGTVLITWNLINSAASVEDATSPVEWWNRIGDLRVARARERMRLRSMSLRWILVAVSLSALVASGCQLFMPDVDLDQGGAMYNATDATIFIYAEMAGGGEIRLGGVISGTTGSVPDPCQKYPLIARHTDDGPIIDTWGEGFCAGDYWSIPKGGLIENRTGRAIAVRALEPGIDSSYSIRIGVGRTGSLRAPCADPPITAGADFFEASPRQEPLCVGDVWVIEEP